MIAGKTYDRQRAWDLLNEWTQSPSLIKHALAVETCVRAYGEREAYERGLVGEEGPGGHGGH